MLLFTLNASALFGKKVADHLGVPLAPHEEREFEDGEHKIRPLVNVRGRDAFVIHSLYGEPGQSVNDKLCRLLFFTGALKDAGAGKVTAVVPYFAYARKDRKTKSRDPLTLKYVAQLLEAAGVDHVAAQDIHNPSAYQNAFRIPTEHLESHSLFVARLAEVVGEEKIVVVSPDPGGMKRAEAFRERLSTLTGQEAGRAFLEKSRSAGVVSGEVLAGNVQGRTAVIIDDIISSGTTISRAVDALVQRGAGRILAVAGHGIFTGKAGELLAPRVLESILVTDSIPPFRLAQGAVRQKLEILSVAPLFAQAIKRMHEGGSVSDLLTEFPGTPPLPPSI